MTEAVNRHVAAVGMGINAPFCPHHLAHGENELEDNSIGRQRHSKKTLNLSLGRES